MVHLDRFKFSQLSALKRKADPDLDDFFFSGSGKTLTHSGGVGEGCFSAAFPDKRIAVLFLM